MHCLKNNLKATYEMNKKDLSLVEIASDSLDIFKKTFGSDLRVYGTEENPLFVGKDVCDIIKAAGCQ
jgi:hypothetical protein